MKRAFITGILGQDGAYLSKFLLNKGYKVYGLIREPRNRANTWRLDYLEISDQVVFIKGDLLDINSLLRGIEQSQADEVYNLAAVSYVGTSIDLPMMASEVTATGAVRVLEAVRKANPQARFFQASSSGLFGPNQPTPQTETCSFDPQNPYAMCKLHAHLMTISYREFHDIFACNGILFNHESPLRSEHFVTRKITRSAAQIKKGILTELRLGNITTKRDFGFAGDYIECMWMMLQQEKPEDYVIATGSAREIREFIELAFKFLDLNWKEYVKIDRNLFRSNEIPIIHGDSTKAIKKLGWNPHKTSFEELVEMMVKADLGRMA